MNDTPPALRNLARQEQFLEVVDRDEATARFQQHLKMRPLGAETIPLSEALGRILACAVIADVDVPASIARSSTGLRCAPMTRLGQASGSRSRWC